MGWTSNWNKKTFAKPTYPKSLWISCMLWYPEVSHITWDVWSCSRVSGSLPWISQMDAKSWMEAPKSLVTQNPWSPCNVCYSFVETFSWEKVFATILFKKSKILWTYLEIFASLEKVASSDIEICFCTNKSVWQGVFDTPQWMMLQVDLAGRPGRPGPGGPRSKSAEILKCSGAAA